MTSMYFQFLGVQGGYGSSSTAIYGPNQCIALFSIAVPNYLPFRPSSPGCLCWTKKNHAKSSLHTTNHRATRNPWPQRPRTVHESLIYTGVVWNSTVWGHNKETDLLTKNDGLSPKTLPLQFIFAFGSQFGLAPSRWFEIPFHGCEYSGQLWYDQCGFFGGRLKQVGFLVSDLQLRYYLVNYKFLTDVPQITHTFFPSHGWKKEICDLASVFEFWVDESSKRVFLLVTSLSKLQISHRFLTISSQISSYPCLKKICDLADVFEFLVGDSSN
jgi:hypothetical protein